MNIKISQCKNLYASLDKKTQKQIRNFAKNTFRNKEINLQKNNLNSSIQHKGSMPENSPVSDSRRIVEDVRTFAGYASFDILV